jgi:glycosyltransferase involved in cell wall biosynthesis
MAIAYRRLYPHADAVICPAQAIADSLHREFGIDTRRLRLIYNPVDETAIRAAATPIMREPGPGARFVAAGRLTAQKGFDRLLDMMAEIPGDGRLTILGDGSDRPALEAQAARLNIGGRVTFAGFDGSPWARYAGADAFLLPSRWEGMPNAALEALACGTKVIACPEAGGIGEVAALASAGAVTVAPAGPDFVAALRGTVVASPANLRPSLLPAQFEFAKAARAFEAVLDATASLDQPARRAA